MSNHLCPYCYDSLSEHLDEKLDSCLRESKLLSNKICLELKERLGNFVEI